MLYGHYYRIWEEKDYWVAISGLEDEKLPPLAGTDVVALIHLVAKYEEKFEAPWSNVQGNSVLSCKMKVRILQGLPFQVDDVVSFQVFVVVAQ